MKCGRNKSENLPQIALSSLECPIAGAPDNNDGNIVVVVVIRFYAGRSSISETGRVDRASSRSMGVIFDRRRLIVKTLQHSVVS